MRHKMGLIHVRQSNAASSAPPGVTPNYINPSWRGGEAVISNSLLGVLALAFVVARLCVRNFMVKIFYWDDCKAQILSLQKKHLGLTIYRAHHPCCGMQSPRDSDRS